MHNPWSEWDLNQWLKSLETRNTQEIQLGMERILEVAQRLNVLHPDFKVITVAGTNGKGSTVNALETIYRTAGYRVGSYTSPHLIDFNERIKINLKPISNRDLCKSFCVIEEARQQVNLTYFEMTTLAALWHFKHQNLDIVILEVGLGGRLDATNIINPDLSIITTIDFDHQEFLGSTLDAIGYEKAGILRNGKPFIYTDTNPPESILKIAKSLEAPGYFYNVDFSTQDHEEFWSMTFGETTINVLPKPQIQIKSASAAITASFILNQYLPVTYDHLCSAMNDIFIPGRLQLIKGRVNILYDVSHNPQSARLLAETIKNLNLKNKVHTVFSALKDKDLYGLIFPLKDCVDHWYPAQLDNKRASSVEMLRSAFKEAEILVEICYTSPLIAFEVALNKAKAGDLIVIYGSFFTVSQVMAAQHDILELKEI